MRVNENEVEAEIEKRVVVTRQLITFAKGFLQDLKGIGPHDPRDLIEEFAQCQGYKKPDKIVLHPSVDAEPNLRQAVGYFSCSLALAEALYSLIHSGYFLSHGNSQSWSADLSWTTVVPGSGGNSGGWRFSEFDLHLPFRIVLAPSCRHEHPQPLTDAGLFAAEAGIQGAHPEVIEALQDAVQCFRHDLYRPAVTLLGKAVEGAWIELGYSLSAAVTAPAHDHTKFEAKLKGEEWGFFRKIEEAVKLCRHEDWLGAIFRDADIRLAELEEIAHWSHLVREARNAIHFGARPVVGNTYEKVSALLLGAAKNLKAIYRLKASAENVVTLSRP